jgi:hypothetical protein
MKMNHVLMMGAAMASLSLVTTAEVRAQAAVETTTTTTRTLGTISEFGPETIIVRPERGEEPIRYSFTKTTIYVDENGVPVSVETVKTGVPVTVEYSRVGDRLVAKRVIVRRTVTRDGATVIDKKTTTTTTTTEKK